MNWLIEHIPFPFLILGGVGIVGLAWRFLGIKGAGAALVGLASLLIFREGRKDGRQSQINQDRKEAAHVVNEATQARIDAARRDHGGGLRSDDGFRRD